MGLAERADTYVVSDRGRSYVIDTVNAAIQVSLVERQRYVDKSGRVC
ncbi:MAG TPA: hypothetical protein VLK82_23500 [Candidatus Tectomicrobia bacterium]|nr:hypothetical protein [Candidatus Tectomicrobia bacterium]